MATTMSPTQIKTAIQAWDAINKNGSAMLSQFAQGNSFNFIVPPYATGSETMHVYLGIVSGQLTFFSIPQNYDKSQYASTINNYVTVSDAIWTVQGGGRIPSNEAQARIDRWGDNYTNWVPARAATAYGVFQAFAIPMEDYESTDCSLILGLRLEPLETQGMAADMLVKNVNRQEEVVFYDDFVQPVPPFGATATAASFYLLQP